MESVVRTIKQNCIQLNKILQLLVRLSLKYNQQDAMFSPSTYFYKLLYMFQVVPLPLIKSTKLYVQRQVLSNQ
jgi:hypothetical protein